MSLAHRLLRFIAPRLNVPREALEYFFAGTRIGRGADTRLPFPSELIPIGARLLLRGWLNRKFFPAHRDWILPYWAERQFDPRDPAFTPYGFELYTINYAYRDWTMIGNLSRSREAIVDPRGLLTPWFNGWSLDVWVEMDGRLFVPSRLPESTIRQSLHENLPIVVTQYRVGDVRVELETFAGEESGREWVIENIALTNISTTARRITLCLAFRPFNPEGVALIQDIEYRTNPNTTRDPEHVVLINRALAAILLPPDAFATSARERGDVAHSLPIVNSSTRIADRSGLATALAAYHLELGSNERKALSVLMPMTHEEIQEDDPFPIMDRLLPEAVSLRLQSIAVWHETLAHGMRVELPDENLQRAFEANKAYLLLLHDGDSITPGPLTYHQFWMRDAAYMLNALDKLGYHAESRAVIENLPRRLQKDGYVRATEGEWDSNGAAIWTLVEHARLSGENEILFSNYWSLLRMASWIHSKRQVTKSAHSPHSGLLPSGPSAEHLGPPDYYYWDDFWSLAGLRDTALAAQMLGQQDDAKRLRAHFDTFRADVDASLAASAARLGRKAMPASPYRNLDAGMIGSLVAAYPLRLLNANDERIVDTLAALKENAWIEDAYFNHVGHAAFGTYLSLHIAQCLIFQRSLAAWDTLNWVLRHASSTFTWAEGIHPRTRRGGMGDGHHGWAAADFVLAVRNALLVEEEDRLIITPILPQDWVIENNVIKVEGAATYFGNVNFTIAFGERTATLVVKSDWREVPASIEWCLPFTPREVGDEAQIVGNVVRLPRGSARTVVLW